MHQLNHRTIAILNLPKPVGALVTYAEGIVTLYRRLLASGVFSVFSFVVFVRGMDVS